MLYLLTILNKNVFKILIYICLILCIGHVSGGLPTVKLPTSAIQNKTLTQVIKQLGSAVIAVPFISIMETIAIGKAFGKNLVSLETII